METVSKTRVHPHEVVFGSDMREIVALNKFEAVVRFFNAEKFSRPEAEVCVECLQIEACRVTVRRYDRTNKRYGPRETFIVIVNDIKRSLPELPERHVHFRPVEK